jgi:dihydropyrimidinase
LLVYG